MLSEFPSGKRCQVNSLRNWNLCLSKDYGKNRSYLLYSKAGFNLEYFDSRLVTLLENSVPRQQKTLHKFYQIQYIILAGNIKGNAAKWKYCISMFLSYQSLLFHLIKTLEKNKKRANNWHERHRSIFTFR